MLDLLAHDTSLWIGISFVIFILIAYKLGGKTVTAALDSKIQSVKDDVENAEKIRVEAQELLAQYELKKQEIEKETQQIIEKAQLQAEKINAEAQVNLDDLMQRRESQLQARLQRMEESAINDIKAQAAELIIQQTKDNISASLNTKKAKELHEDTISSIANYIN